MLQLAESTLAQWLWEVKPKESDDLRWRFTCQIIHGVASIHERRILHLDLKPANILMVMQPKSYCAKISDFGLSQKLNESGMVEVTGESAYTPGYRPQEAVMAGRREAGLRSMYINIDHKTLG
jgi:serine/threonine protein kinase